MKVAISLGKNVLECLLLMEVYKKDAWFSS